MLNLSTPRIGTQRTVQLDHGRQATVEVIGDGPPMFWFEGGPGLPARLSRPEAELFDLRPRLAKVARPTLVICGELDPICGPAQARQIAATVPGADLVTVLHCGHFA